jgi:hypothetical protein
MRHGNAALLMATMAAMPAGVPAAVLNSTDRINTRSSSIPRERKQRGKPGKGGNRPVNPTVSARTVIAAADKRERKAYQRRIDK